MKIEIPYGTVKFRTGKYVVFDIDYFLRHQEEEIDLLMLYMRQKRINRPTLDKEWIVRGNENETKGRNRFAGIGRLADS